MKTLRNRILTACLALTMALAAAAPAMAAETRAINSPVGHIVKFNSCGMRAGPALRANGNYNQAPVDSSTYSSANTSQKWHVIGSGNEGQIYTMQGSQQYAVNLYRTAVTPGVYPVTIATTSGNLDDTLFHFSNYEGNTCRMWLQQGTFAGYRLYTDKSNPGSWSDVFFYQSDNAPNSVWYWSYVTV